MEYGNILSSKDKMLIKICGDVKDFLPEHSSGNALTNSGKTLDNFLRKLRTISSTALKEAVDH